MKFRTPKSVFVAALLGASLGATCAHAEGLYVGGSLGAPRYGDSVNGISGSGNGLSGKLFGGYQLTPNFALEAGVADLRCSCRRRSCLAQRPGRCW